MLEEIKKKVYGLDEYEKVRLDDRFLSLVDEVELISIKSPEELEDVEEIIYKIKELLRVKSSNLNKCIKDPSRKIRRKDVQQIIDTLISKKRSVLQYLFSSAPPIQEKIEIEEEQIDTEPPVEEEPKTFEPEFIEVEKIKEEPIVNQKEEEESLDSLLGEIHEKKPTFNPEPEPQKDPTPPSIEEVEPIVIEEKKEKEPEFVLETTSDHKFILYKDDAIVVFLNEESEVPGEMVIESITNTPIKDMDESKISYVVLFSKIFASTIFEVAQAQGTNIVWNYKGTQLRIIPRYMNDTLALKWDGKQASDEFLEQIKSKLLEEMVKEKTKEEESVKEPSVQEEQVDLSDKREKLDEILKAIRRIPN